MLSIKNLSKTYGARTVLNNVSLTVPHGHIAVLLGSSGVGKSTLLRILNNLETYDSGTIVLDNKQLDITQVNQSHAIGMVFQHFNLFEHMTVERNITFALEKVLHKTPAQAHALACNLLAQYGLADKAKLSIGQLSGGQKQRLAIARSLALKPRVICLDEPTSALDPLLTYSVAQAIQDLAQQGYIVLVASHDISLVQRLTCTVHLMDQGSIIQSATTQELIDDLNRYPQIKAFMQGTSLQQK